MKIKCNSQSVKLRQKSKIPGKLYFTTVYFIVEFFDNKSEVIRVISYIYTILLNKYFPHLWNAFTRNYITYCQSIFHCQIHWKKSKQWFLALALLAQHFNWINWWRCHYIYLFGKNPSFVCTAELRILVKNYLPSAPILSLKG